jgi:CBS domain-containing protein
MSSLPTVVDLVKDQRPVVYLKTKDSVNSALAKLAEANITSAPVVSDDGKIHGFVDVVDLLLFLVKICTKQQESKVSPPSTKLTTDDMGIIAKRSSEFYLSSLFEVLADNQLRHDAYYPLHYNAALKVGVEIFLKGVHRIAVTDDSNRIFHILTQSNIIRWLGQDTSRMGLKADLSVSKMDTKKLNALITIPSTTRTIEAFELMKKTGVSSLAVVGKEGVLEGVISASDLKGLKEFAFGRLLLPLSEFLVQVRKEQGKPADFTVTCDAAADLKTVVSRIVQTKVHRVFVIDNAHRPVGVISLTDIIAEVFGNL